MASTTNQSRIEALVVLVAKLDEYISFLGEELGEASYISILHGWRSKRVAQGYKMRREIAVLRRKANAGGHDAREAS